MAIITEADFRAASVAEYCYDIQMETATAPAAALTSTIARMTAKFQEYTNDSFEAEALTLVLQGDGTPTLRLPKRCTAVSQVRTRSASGTYTTQTSTYYRLNSSLYANGSKRQGDVDWLEIVQTMNIGDCWPTQTGSVEGYGLVRVEHLSRRCQARGGPDVLGPFQAAARRPPQGLSCLDAGHHHGVPAG